MDRIVTCSVLIPVTTLTALSCLPGELTAERAGQDASTSAHTRDGGAPVDTGGSGGEDGSGAISSTGGARSGSTGGSTAEDARSQGGAEGGGGVGRSNGSGGTSVDAGGDSAAGGNTGASLVRAQYAVYSDDAVSVSEIKPRFQIVNASATSVPYAELSLRYWFTEDASPDPGQEFICFYAQLGSTNVHGRVATQSPSRPNADRYLEITVSSGAGNLAPMSSSGEIDIGLHNVDFTLMNQANDYSHDATMQTLADWTRVTLYRNGKLLWGIEP